MMDLSKLPEGRKPLPDEWFTERAQMQDRIEELEERLKAAQDDAKRWLNGPLPADLMADLADILDDEDYPPEKRAHQIVWQALKWMMENPVQKETHNDQR